MRTVATLQDPDCGTVNLDGIDLKPWGPQAFVHEVSFCECEINFRAASKFRKARSTESPS